MLAAFSAAAEDLDERATLCARLLHLPPLPELPEALRGKDFAGIDGAIHASDDDALAILRPFADLAPSMNTFSRMPTSEISHIHLDPEQPVPGYSDGVLLDALPPGAIEAVLDAAGPGVSTPLLAVDVRVVGGALGRPDPRGGALDHLPGRFLLNAVGIAPTPEAIAAVDRAVRSLIAALEPWRAERDYTNFRESSDRPERFYPEDVLVRLREVKSRYDPQNIIRGCHELT